MNKLSIFKKIKDLCFSRLDIKSLNKTAIFTILAFVLFLAVLIPVQVMSMAAAQFVIQDHSPLKILFYTIIVYGILGAILYAIYFISRGENAKRIVLNVFTFLLVYLVINYFIYGTVDAVMNNMLVYEHDIFERNYDEFDYVYSVIIIIISIFISIFLSKCEKLRKDLVTIILICIVLFSVFKAIIVHQQTDPVVKNYGKMQMWTSDEIKPIYNFSKNKQNVVVFMVDRFTGKYFEQVIRNYPALKKKFNGFTFYPNTLAFGPQTTSGSPGLFGGYEYIPSESDKRTEELVVDKHNEALKVMPKIFGDNNFDVVASNLPEVNYQDPKRKNPFTDLKNFKIRSYVGRIKDDIIDDSIVKVQTIHFIQYPFMMFLPLFLRKPIYSDGNYFIRIGYPYTLSFLNYLVAFRHMDKMTSVSNTDRNQAIIINNEMTHEQQILSYPDFEVIKDKEVAADVKNTQIVATTSDIDYYNRWNYHMVDYAYYDSCVRATIDLGNWLDYLRKLGVYDNTRIIITSDHGLPPYAATEKTFKTIRCYESKYKYPKPEILLSTLSYNPVMLYKDFKSKGALKISNSFMTNADTPYLAMKGIIKNIKNPYTGNPISTEYKNRGKFYMAYETDPWQPTYHLDEYKYETQNRIFLSLEGKNVFDLDKWDAITNFNSLVCDVHRNIVKHSVTEKETCGINVIKEYYECKDCKMCFYDKDATERIYNMSEVQINIPHKFTNYISNNDEKKGTHGTMTAECDYGCGTKDTKGDPSAKLNHELYIVIDKEKPSFDHDGYEGHSCSYCGKKLDGNAIPKLKEPELEYTETIYDKTKKEPKVTIRDGYGEIIDKEKYRVKYSKNKNVGTAEVTITMRTPYEGETTVYFEIKDDK